MEKQMGINKLNYPTKGNKFKLEIIMENAIFDNIPDMVLSDMLRATADKIDRGLMIGAVMDLNGNTVGWFEMFCD